jgi:hypothetical protein
MTPTNNIEQFEKIVGRLIGFQSINWLINSLEQKNGHQI